MNRPRFSIVLMIATLVVAAVVTASPAQAQLFRRWRQARQNAATSNRYQQPQQVQARNQPQAQNQARGYQQRFQQQPQSSQNRYLDNQQSLSNQQSLGNQQRQVPATNDQRTPRVVGPVRFPNQPAAPAMVTPGPIINPSRTPTLAQQPKKVSDTFDGSQKVPETFRRSNDGAKDLGQSILSRQGTGADETDADIAEDENAEVGNANGADESDVQSASMGLEIYRYSTPQNGVRIARIKERSQADESGIRVGDMIVAVDRTRTRSAEDVAAILKQHRPGSSLRVQFVRDSISYVTDVPLIASEFSVAKRAFKNNSSDKSSLQDRVAVAKPPTNSPNQNPTPSPSIKLGMLIQDNPSLRGTMVTQVRPGSIAESSGLKKGDRIVSVQSRLLEGGNQLRQIVSGSTWGDQLAMGIVRDGELISRKVNFTRTPETKLAKSKPKSKKDSNEASASSLSKGFGSLIGGLFAGGSQEKKETTKRTDQVAKFDGAKQTPGRSLEKSEFNTSIDPNTNMTDPLGFGDDEPIEQVIFQKDVK